MSDGSTQTKVGPHQIIAELRAEVQAANQQIEELKRGKEEAMHLATDQVKVAVAEGFQLRQISPSVYEWKNSRAELAEQQLAAAQAALLKLKEISEDGIHHDEYCDDKCGACRISELLAEQPLSALRGWVLNNVIPLAEPLIDSRLGSPGKAEAFNACRMEAIDRLSRALENVKPEPKNG